MQISLIQPFKHGILTYPNNTFSCCSVPLHWSKILQNRDNGWFQQAATFVYEDMLLEDDN